MKRIYLPLALGISLGVGVTQSSASNLNNRPETLEEFLNAPIYAPDYPYTIIYELDESNYRDSINVPSGSISPEPSAIGLIGLAGILAGRRRK